MTKQTLMNAVMAASLLFTFGAVFFARQVTGGAEAIGNETAPSSGKIERNYTMKASVRLLLFWIGRDGVGGGRITWIEDAGGKNGFELLIGSDPDRAPRRINRWGYIAEHFAGSTAELIGVMTQSDEQSIEQADKGTKGPEKAHQFKAMHSIVNGGEAQSRITRWSTDEDFTFRDYKTVLNKVANAQSTVRKLKIPKNADPGFLFAVKSMLHASVEGFRQSDKKNLRRPPSRSYVYNASLFTLSMTSSKLLETVVVNGRTYAAIIESAFEAKNSQTGKTSKFKISYGTDPSISEVPVRIVYQPRWWFQAELQLKDDARMMRSSGGVEKP
jgi:hypothetical protein